MEAAAEQAIPNRLVFDLEIARPLPEDQGRPCWDLADQCGVSVLGGWGTTDLAPRVWLLDDTRLPAPDDDGADLRSALHWCDGLVSWNGVRFDMRVMAATARADMAVHAWNERNDGPRHVDLLAVCIMLAKGVPLEALENGVRPGWDREYVLARMERSEVFRGWSLDQVAEATLGHRKTGNGAAAPLDWQAGKYGRVIRYCIHDVALTRALWWHARNYGWLASPEHGRVEIPRSVL